jgi:hypothetical protein
MKTLMTLTMCILTLLSALPECKAEVAYDNSLSASAKALQFYNYSGLSLSFMGTLLV